MTGSRAAGSVCGAVVALLMGPASPALAQSYRSLSVSRQAQGEADLSVDVQFAAGTFQLRAAPEGTLYRATLVYDEEQFEPLTQYDPASRALQVGVDGHGKRRDFKNSKQRLDLAIGPTVPARVNLEFGAAAANVELGGLSLLEVAVKTGASRSSVAFSHPNRIRCDHLEIQLGAAEFEIIGLGNARCANVVFGGAVGNLTLDFGGTWDSTPEMRADLDLGLASLTLRLPRDLGVEIELSRFLVSFDDVGFTKRGNSFVSNNFDRAQTRVHLTIDAAMGGIDVVWID